MCRSSQSLSPIGYDKDMAHAELKVYEAVTSLVVQRFNEPDRDADKGFLITSFLIRTDASQIQINILN